MRRQSSASKPRPRVLDIKRTTVAARSKKKAMSIARATGSRRGNGCSDDEPAATALPSGADVTWLTDALRRTCRASDTRVNTYRLRQSSVEHRQADCGPSTPWPYGFV